MKPADRALDLAVVGLGQAGGNLAAEFASRGYRALALNTAHTDLSSLAPGIRSSRTSALPAEQRIYVGIDGYDGAGADLNYGRECIRTNARRIREAIVNHAEGADAVIIAAGLGGGTGSAISELVRTIEDLDLPIITLTTLPSNPESGIAKVNAVRAMSDLIKLEGVGWIFADNSRLAEHHGATSLDRYFEKVNSVLIDPLDAFNRLNDRSDIYPIRTLDGEDFRALLLSNGVINYGVSALAKLTVDAVAERIRESLQSSTMMATGYSPAEISYMGVVIEAPEEVLSETPFSFFEELNEVLKDETGGGALYLGIYRTNDDVEGGAALLRTICSAQTMPEGIQAIVNDARREGGALQEKLHRSMAELDLGEIENFDLFKTSVRSGGGGRRSRRPAPPDFEVPEVAMPVKKARGPSIPPVTGGIRNPSRPPPAPVVAEEPPPAAAPSEVSSDEDDDERPTDPPISRAPERDEDEDEYEDEDDEYEDEDEDEDDEIEEKAS